jgi:Clp amino terminal domain, pathogenicity island component
VLERFSDEARTAVDLAQAEARRLGHDHVGTEHLLLGILTEGHSRAARALIAVGVTPSACRQKVAEAVGKTTPSSRDGELDLTDRARRSLQRAVRLANRQRQDHVEPEHILLSVIQVEGRAGQVLRGLGVDPARVRTMVAEQEAAGDGPAASASGGAAAGAGPPAGAGDAHGAEAALIDGPNGAAMAPPASPTPRPGRAGRGARSHRSEPAERPSPTSRVDGLPAPVCANCGVALDGSLAHRALASSGEAGDLRAFAVVYCVSCGSAIGVTTA